MVRAQIVIKLSNGSSIFYANKFLKEKTGYDAEEEPKNKMFPGFPCYNYYYTGYGTDKYENQTNPGEIKADYEFIRDQLDSTKGKKYLVFPESDSKAVSSISEGKDEIVRRSGSDFNLGIINNRIKILLSEVVSVSVSESWVRFPYGRESGYTLPKNSPDFLGFRETIEREEKGYSKGPDFNKYKNEYTGYVPTPIAKYKIGGEITIINDYEFKEIVKKVDDYGGTTIYGIKEFSFEGKTITKKSGTIYVPKWVMPSKINYEELEDYVSSFKAGEYSFEIDTTGVPAKDFNKENGDSSSKFNETLLKAKEGVMLNLTFALPDDVEEADSMLINNTHLKSVNITKANGLKDARHMFDGCSKLEEVNTSAFTNVETAYGMFRGCSSLKSVDTKPFTNVIKASSMFKQCKSLTSIDTEPFTKVDESDVMFNECGGLSNIDLSPLSNTTKATNMLSKTNIKNIDISMLKKVTDAKDMFAYCDKLETITWGDIEPGAVTNMFNGASFENKKIIVSKGETRAFIDSKAVEMKLENYEIEGPAAPEPEPEPEPETKVESEPKPEEVVKTAPKKSNKI